ncbi:acetyl esterase/lipase [Actinoalloteichus hoggarensis]|uniref:Carboxylesterase NlhH n=1 Tax=Actinoalloteichus hoggarensis TaxID=1470176 RepID=A0A221W2L6_9PSEU|nr:alpha/beta hydrolase [Actinoalloteichus hoggarensis]ASO20014.1 Carboxylesterase NlhH [Actinoalloteichus hoggarensis]MBB5919276.1 acetyl esterase/lipase [Actinoalloteichus hoggarensis]
MDVELVEQAALRPADDLSDAAAARERDQERARQGTLLGLTELPEIPRHDRTVPGRSGASEVPVRVYVPDSAGVAAPVLLWIHGGAFMLGDLDGSDSWCTRLADAAECVVVSVDYRLAPEHPYPAGLQDCLAVLDWIAEEAAAHGWDPARIAVGGSSAGAGLAAAVALWTRDHGGPKTVFQLLIQPVLDDRRRTPSSTGLTGVPVFDSPALEQMWRHYLAGWSGDVPPYAAPARAANLGGLPPVYLTAADADPLRDEAVEYAGRLVEAGVPTEFHLFPGTFHGFDVCVPDAGVSRRALREYGETLRQALHPPTPA